MKDLITISGKSTDDKFVLAGIGKLSTTYGLPLEVALQHIKDKNLLVDWVDYIDTCMNDGAKPGTIKARILAAVGDVYGPSYRQGFEKRLNEVFEARYAS